MLDPKALLFTVRYCTGLRTVTAVTETQLHGENLVTSRVKSGGCTRTDSVQDIN